MWCLSRLRKRFSGCLFGSFVDWPHVQRRCCLQIIYTSHNAHTTGHSTAFLVSCTKHSADGTVIHKACTKNHHRYPSKIAAEASGWDITHGLRGRWVNFSSEGYDLHHQFMVHKDSNVGLSPDAYAFVSRRVSDQALDVHRLVYLSTRNWLRAEELLARWAAKAIKRLEKVFPDNDYKNRSITRQRNYLRR
jgi:hypothetical protein